MRAVDLPTIESLGGRQEFVTAGDGTRLRYAMFRPENPVARTLFFPGFTEFIEKHLETITEFLERGMRFCALTGAARVCRSGPYLIDIAVISPRWNCFSRICAKFWR